MSKAISLIEEARKLSERFEHGHMIRFKDGCLLAIFRNQVVLWGTSGQVMAWVDVNKNECAVELLTRVDFLDYLEQGLEE